MVLKQRIIKEEIFYFINLALFSMGIYINVESIFEMVKRKWIPKR